MDGELSEEQRQACQEILSKIETERLNIVVQALTAGESRSLAREEFPRLLREAGFNEVTSWALPDARAFARALHEEGRLAHLQQEDLLPYLRGLVRSAPRLPGWSQTWVSCVRK